MKINLKKLMWYQIYLLFIIRFIISVTGIEYLSYLCDVITICMGYIICKHYMKNKMNFIVSYFIVEIIYWIITVFYGDRTNVKLFFIMIRELGRFYIIFLAAKLCMKKKDYQKLFKMIDIVIFIHFALVLIQMYILKAKNGDYVGGIFGIQFGYGNIASHALLIITLIITMYKYLNNEEKITFSICKLIIICSVGMITEMKSIIFEMAIIIILFLLLYKKIKIKNLILIAILIVSMVFFIKYMEEKFNFNIFSTNEIDKYLNSGYAANVNGIGRTDGYDKIYRICFKRDKLKMIFGYGLGAATSDYTYNLYGNMNLEYFTYAKIFYDTGIIGSMLYFGFFIICIINAIQIKKKDDLLCICTIVCAVTSIYLSFYGASMESDFTGYLFYILLAIPYTIKNEKNNE